MNQENFAQCSRCEALAVLGLENSATESDVRSAYRKLSAVWQPDRFSDDEELKKTATEKFKDLTTAFEYLTATSTERATMPRPVYLAAPSAPAVATTAATAAAAAPAPSLWRRIYTLYRHVRLAIRLFLLLLVILRACYVWYYVKLHPAPNSQSVNSGAAPQAARPQPPELPEQKIIHSVETELKNLTPQNSSSTQPEQPAAEAKPSGPSKPSHAATPLTQPGVRTIKPYLTVGSTRDEVIAIQGAPTASTDDKLVYGKSEMYLKDGVVTGWKIDPDASPIRVKLWPQSAVDPDIEFFTVNSTKDEVLVIQGTPTAFSQDTFEYGGSIVYFKNNRVVNWKNDPGSFPLRAR
jgi:hypothetical protein